MANVAKIVTAAESPAGRAPGEAAGDVDIAAVAAMMADASRAIVLSELSDGRALPPSELAAIARVSRSTISEHLAKLERAGRSLSSEEGATATSDSLTAAGAAWLDDLGVVRPPRAGKACNDWSERRPHLAGRLGVALAQRLFELEWLARTDRPRLVQVTSAGRRELAHRLGVSR
jgi:DNA-binding transcriptional ArsR family regulator